MKLKFIGMNSTDQQTYEAPLVEVIEVKTESRILTVSNYNENPYSEE